MCVCVYGEKKGGLEMRVRCPDWAQYGLWGRRGGGIAGSGATGVEWNRDIEKAGPERWTKVGIEGGLGGKPIAITELH